MNNSISSGEWTIETYEATLKPTIRQDRQSEGEKNKEVLHNWKHGTTHNFQTDS